MKLTSVSAVILMASLAAGVAGCAMPVEAELSSTSSELLSGDAVFTVANIFNTGAAAGYMLAFASITPNGNWDTLSTDLADSYSAFEPSGQAVRCSPGRGAPR